MPISELLLNTDGHISQLLPENQRDHAYGKKNAPITGLRDYFYESADLTIDEQMTKFIQDYTSQYGELED